MNRYTSIYKNESIDSKGSNHTATKFKQSINAMADVMKLRIGKEYHNFLNHLRKRCLNSIRRGQKRLVHLYYSYPVQGEGYKSVLKVQKFLKRDVGLNVKELLYQGYIVGFCVQLKSRDKM